MQHSSDRIGALAAALAKALVQTTAIYPSQETAGSPNLSNPTPRLRFPLGVVERP